jgi:hypothetical protein
MLCCCISITKTLPLPLGATFSPNGPESVKKILPVLLESAIELGPSNGVPSYSLTNSAYEPSFEFTAIIDCLSKSAM